MAGGMGTRLRPLTARRPKPMLPVAGRPVMEHIVRLLARHGFREIQTTLQYLPECIQAHFGDGRRWGVAMRHHVEREPLGTAGGVKALMTDLGDWEETYVIISGDALTDVDLTRLVRFHRERGALVTMALRQVEDPSQFGVVEVDGRGRILRFQEKPAPGTAFSNLVNTGIYVIEGRALAAVPTGLPWDFARNLFPLLLERGEPLYGCLVPGYWCDIGTPASYLQANWDCLTGRVAVDMPGRYAGDGIWLGEGVRLGEDVRLEGPALIGDGAVVGSGARIGPFAVVGDGVRVDEGAVLQGAVLWEGAGLLGGTAAAALAASAAR